METMEQMKHSYVKIGLLAVLLLLAVPGRDAMGDTFYQFVDKNGTIHFTNVPTDPRYRVLREDRPAVRLRPTVPDPSLHQTIAQTARRHQVNPALVRAVIKAESAFDTNAVSPKGAMGLMQLMPETANSLNVWNPYDPEQNISGGVRHLRYLLDRFQGDVRLARAAYTAGETRVLRESRVPPITEPRQYVRKVLRFYQDFSREGTGSGSLRAFAPAPAPAPIVTRRFINYLSPE